MSTTETDMPEDGLPTPPGTRHCNADRMQRRHCAYYHEKTGRCTQSSTTTWQERAAQDAEDRATQEE
jgi:hypothetical protein